MLMLTTFQEHFINSVQGSSCAFCVWVQWTGERFSPLGFHSALSVSFLQYSILLLNLQTTENMQLKLSNWQ